MAGIQPWEDLKEHAGTLVALIAFLTLIVVGMVKGWWTDTTSKFKKIEDTTAKEFEDVWTEVNRLKQNQVELRENTLPKYLLKTDWQEMNHERLATLQRIEKKIDGFVESCRKGECARGGDRG